MAVIALGVTLGAAACSSGPQVDTEEETTARDVLVGLLNTRAMNTFSASVADFARAAGGRAGIDVIAMEEKDAAEYVDPFGSLTFAVLLDDPMYTQTGGLLPTPDWDPGPYCFRVPFDAYGKHGEFGTTDAISLVECPEGAEPITLPPDDAPDDGEPRGG